MRNNKVVVINGLAYSGTNILWNIIASHPKVCLPRYETSEILAQIGLLKHFVGSRFRLCFPIRLLAAYFFDRHCYSLKLGCLECPDHRMSSEYEVYTEKEIADSALCLKSLYEEIELTNFFRRVYPNSYFIGIVRNGYAFCESIVRRNGNADAAGRLYHRYVRMMIEQQTAYDRYIIVRFEEILRDPFGAGRLLYKFLDLQPTSVSKLRLKAKRVVTHSGDHSVRFGQEHRHYWFGEDEISSAIDQNIDDVQSSKLSESDKAAFVRHANSELEHFHYQ